MAKTQKDYLAIAKKKVNRPRDREGRRRYLIYGRNKKGKTTFSLSAGVEETLLIDPESGTDSMMLKNPWRWPIEKWEDVSELMGALRTGKLSPNFFKQGESSTPFSWVSPDGLTKLNWLALRYIMRIGEQRDLDRRPGIIDRRDYNKSGELMKELISQFHALPMNVCFTAQERMQSMDTGDNDDDEETTFFVADLPNGVRASVNQVVEVIGRIYTVRVTVKGKDKIQRRLHIAPHERYDTGFRSDFDVPEFIRYPTIPKLNKILLEGEG